MGRPTLEQELENVRYDLANANAFIPKASRAEIKEWKATEVELVDRLARRKAKPTGPSDADVALAVKRLEAELNHPVMQAAILNGTSKKRGRPKGSKNKVTPVPVEVPVVHPLEQLAEKRREIPPTPVHSRRNEYDDPFPAGTEALLDGLRVVACLGAYTRASTLFIIPGEAGDLKHVVNNGRLEKI